MTINVKISVPDEAIGLLKILACSELLKNNFSSDLGEGDFEIPTNPNTKENNTIDFDSIRNIFS